MSYTGKHRRESARGKLVNKHDNKKDDWSVSTGQVQNKKSGRVYVFGDGDLDEEEILYEASELSEVRTRGKARHNQNEARRQEPQEESFIERDVCEGETLQSIALKYGCRTSELKRLNNLIRDQDFYALTVIKVPVKRFGLLTELIEEEKEAKKLSKVPKDSSDVLEVMEANEINEDEDEIDDSDSRSLLIRKVSIRDAFGTQSRDAASFLQKMDSDIHNIISSTKLRMDSLEEVTKSLTCKRIHPLQRQTSWLSGVDCGIRWWSALILFLVVGLLMPTFFILFVKYGQPGT